MDRTGMHVLYTLPDGPSEGETRPAFIVKDWNAGQPGPGAVNLQVLTDSANDKLPVVLWATSVVYDPDGAAGSWRFLPGEMR